MLYPFWGSSHGSKYFLRLILIFYLALGWFYAILLCFLVALLDFTSINKQKQIFLTSEILIFRQQNLNINILYNWKESGLNL